MILVIFEFKSEIIVVVVVNLGHPEVMSSGVRCCKRSDPPAGQRPVFRCASMSIVGTNIIWKGLIRLTILEEY